MMIGIGVEKECDAALFLYIGNDEKPADLMTKAGKPLTRLGNVKLVDVDIVTGIGTENATKLNVILELHSGNKILVTSGIQTWWAFVGTSGVY